MPSNCRYDRIQPIGPDTAMMPDTIEVVIAASTRMSGILASVIFFSTKKPTMKA